MVTLTVRDASGARARWTLPRRGPSMTAAERIALTWRVYWRSRRLVFIPATPAHFIRPLASGVN